MRESRRATRRPGGWPGSSRDVTLAEGNMFMALAGSPSEKPIAVIYGASDVYGAVPLPLTSPKKKNICNTSKSARGTKAEIGVCARGRGDMGDMSPSMSPHLSPAELVQEQPVPLEGAWILPTALPSVFPSSSRAERY